MTGGVRWLVIGLFTLCLFLSPVLGDAPAQAPNATPPAVTEDMARLLGLGQLLMGQNNPTYAAKTAVDAAPLDAKARNQAGVQALRTFQQLTARYPKFAEGWLWLGIAFTETLDYSPQHPNGEPIRNATCVAEGMRALRTAYDLVPDNLIYATYYGEALMAYCQDFDGARTFWENYLKNYASSDMKRVTALTQAARACVNKAYFGKVAKTISDQDAKALYLTAEKYVAQAAAIFPRAPDVLAMQELLLAQRSLLLGAPR